MATYFKNNSKGHRWIIVLLFVILTWMGVSTLFETIITGSLHHCTEDYDKTTTKIIVYGIVAIIGILVLYNMDHVV